MGINLISLKVLVTGGLGYIGSHVTTLLLSSGYAVVCLDNLDNSSEDVLERIKAISGKSPEFKAVDVRDKIALQQVFTMHGPFDGIIHFAAYKAVEESIKKPLEYYENNITGLINILSCASVTNTPFIFSSSCTVYGQAKELPIDESAPLQPAVSPYGNTKKMGEEIIRDTCQSSKGFKAILLRYFNPIGAHPSGKIGEKPKGVPQNLVPYLTQTVAGIRPILNVFGNQYDTPDGTCIRDYIHVMDLAQAHIDSLVYLLKDMNVESCEVFNVGTGNGVSVLELIIAFERATGLKVPYTISAPRAGDTVSAYASTKKITHTMKWKPKYTLEEALLSAWKWEQQLISKSK